MDNELALKFTTPGADAAAAKVKQVSDRISDAGKQTSSFSEKLQKASLAITAVGTGLTAYSKKATDSTVAYVKSINSIARVTGDSVEQTSRLQYVFQRTGIAANQTAQVFGIFSKQIAANNESIKDNASKQAEYANKIQAAKIKVAELTAEQKAHGDKSGDLRNKIEALNLSIKGYQKQMGEAVTPLQKIGVATQDATGKTRGFSEILLDVADKFKEMPNGAEKTALALQLFGRSGKDLLPVLNRGREGIEELQKQADKLGFTITGKNVDAVAKYIEAQKKLKDAQQAFTLEVGQRALPMWQKLADAQVKATQLYREMPKPLQDVVTGIAAFGGPIATAVGGLTGFAANLVSAAPAAKGFGNALKGITGSFGWVTVIALAVTALIVFEQKTGLLTKALEKLKPVGQVIADFFNGVLIPALRFIGGVLRDVLIPAWESLKNSLQRIYLVMEPIMPILEGIAKFFGAVLVGAIILVAATLTGLITVFAAVVAGIAQLIAWGAQFNAWLLDSAVKVAGVVLQIGAWFGRLPGYAEAAVKNVSDWFKKLPGRILEELGDLKNLLYDAGKSILDGLARGIKAAADVPKKAMKDALDKIKNLLPHSPAKEGPFSGKGWTLFSGMSISQALGEGIAKAAPAAYSKMSSVMSELSTLASPTIGVNGSSSFNGNSQTSESVPLRAPTSQGDVNVTIKVTGNIVGGDDASTRSLAVQFAQLTEQALRGQGVNNVSQLRTP